MVGGEALFDVSGGPVVDDELQRIQHGNAAGSDLVQHLAPAVLEGRGVDHRVALGDARALPEELDTLGRVAAGPAADQRGHGRVVPSLPMSFFSELELKALA